MSSSGRGRVTGPLASYAEGFWENVPGQGYRWGPAASLDGGLAAAGGTEQLYCGCLRRLADGLGGWGPGEPSADP